MSSLTVRPSVARCELRTTRKILYLPPELRVADESAAALRLLLSLLTYSNSNSCLTVNHFYQ